MYAREEGKISCECGMDLPKIWSLGIKSPIFALASQADEHYMKRA